MQFLAQGMTEYVPVNFQDQYFAIMNCHIQSVLTDFRFRQKNYQQIHDEYFSLKKTDVVDNMSLADFFFADENGQLPMPLDLREVDLIYNDYIRVMTIMYEKLKGTFNTFVGRFLSEEERNEH